MRNIVDYIINILKIGAEVLEEGDGSEGSGFGAEDVLMKGDAVDAPLFQDRLFRFGKAAFRTDEEADLSFVSDGGPEFY